MVGSGMTMTASAKSLSLSAEMEEAAWSGSVSGSAGGATPALQLSVVDVYEAASEIGADLEHLAQQFGRDSITKLVPKVCAALEQLEQLAGSGDRETARATQQRLQAALHTVELHQQEKRSIRDKHHAEMEELEREYRDETKRLETAVLDLTSENDKLRSALRTTSAAAPDTPLEVDRPFGYLTLTTSTPAPAPGDTSTLIQQLKDSLAKVKEDLRETAAHLQDRETEAATLRADLQRERTALVNSKQRHNTLHKQARKLMEERNALTGLLRQSLLTTVDLEARLRTAGIPANVPAVAKEEANLQALFEKAGTPLVSPEEVPEVPETREPLRLVQSEREVGGAVDDGDVPRFTLNELRRMLNERNHLKAKVMELQDELAAGKTPRAALDAHLQPWRYENPASGSTGTAATSVADEAESSALASTEAESVASQTDDEEAAVQGPINREPDDKLFPGRRRRSRSRSKPRPSIIRNLYKGLFGEKLTAIVKDGIFYKLAESSAHLAD
ncbi:RILP-like protein homolog [Paramacrobiotus metropolitanus]|uniref:RILP-like protein homolog n=1 Tax=Paramacrobiotus metropolitanus TaxID=2943436 RepID=UPI002446111B|nr:RILP-like protein homolog [Paramacrobiotus metropolitanus]